MDAPTGTELVDRARALAPVLAEHAAEAERRRRPVDEVLDGVAEAGIFRLLVPRRFGGAAADLDDFLEVGLALGRSDAAASWVCNFYVEHNWIFSQFPEAFQKELFGPAGYVLAPGMISPSGQARPVDGGYRLDGRWQWSTGIMHATWVIVGAMVRDDDGQVVDVRWLAVPIDEVEIIDTWHVAGMAGTGSNDVALHDVFVPDERTVAVGDMAAGTGEGAALYDQPIFRTPMLPVLTLAATMPALGQALTAVERFRERLLARTPTFGTTVQADDPIAQSRLAELTLQVAQAEQLLRSTVADVQARRGDASAEDRSRWAAAFALVVRQSLAIVRSVSELSGASAQFLDDPLQRALRDLTTLSKHVVFGLESQYVNYGRVLLGRDPSNRLL